MRKVIRTFNPDGAALGETTDVVGILAKLAIGQLIDNQLDKTLRTHPGMVITIEAPSEGWTTALRRQLNLQYPDVVAQGYRQGKRVTGSAEEDNLVAAQRGGSAVFAISTDVEGLVPLPLRVAADVKLQFSCLTRRSLRKAIAQITGSQVRGLLAADTALDLPDLCAALRPGSRPGDCLRRLRLAAVRLEQAFAPQGDVPTLDVLPLNTTVRAWSEDMLIRLHQFKNHQIKNRDAPYTLLAGPPGTGKTLLAQSVAQTAGWRFVTTSVSDWFEHSDGHLGGVTRAAAEFFRLVEEKDCTIGFIDELEAIPDRRALAPEHREWWNTVVTGVLLNIDKLRRSNKSVVLLAATNYPHRVDDAILRHGRIGHKVMVNPPRTRAEVADLFHFYVGDALEASQLQRVVDFAFALGLPTPAAIADWAGTAKARASAGSRQLTVGDLEHVIAGNDNRGPAELYRTAVHEAGHAIVAAVLGVPVNAVSIIKQGNSAGSMNSDLGGVTMDRGGIEDLVSVALAGRAADLELLGRCDAGARSDLSMATQLLFDGQFRFGVFDQLLTFELDASRVHELDHAIRTALEKRLQQLMQRSRALVLRNRSSVEALAERLVERRVVSGEEVRRIARGVEGAEPLLPQRSD